MKLARSIMILMMVVLTGCQDDFVSYDKEKLIPSTQKLSIDPEIPEKAPFKPDDIDIAIRNVGKGDAGFMQVEFIKGEKGVSFRTMSGPNGVDYTQETVEISEDLKGRYGERNGTKLLKWNKNDVYYEVFSESNGTTKNLLVTFARNFQSIE